MEEIEKLETTNTEQSNENGNKKSAKVNYIYNMLYQVFILLIPLVTIPYISRVLGAAGVGAYGFANSITTYFVLVASLGFGYYAQREIARYQDNKLKQSYIFWEIQICKIFFVFAASILDLVLALTSVYKEYTTLMLIMIINVVSVFFDITFLYQGNEEFGKIVLRNVVCRTIGLVCIFVFVKKAEDLWIYALFQSGLGLLSNLSLWLGIKKYLEKIVIKNINFKQHLIPTIRLFIPTIAVTVYTVLDKTLIGVMIPGETTFVQNGEEVVKKIADLENGYYEQAEKIVKMCMTIVTALGTVMVPKNSFDMQSGNIEKVKQNIYKAISFVFFLGIPIMFGLAAVAINFSPWFFGEGYEKVPYLIMILSLLILAIGLNNVFGIQYLLPAGKDNIYTLSVVLGSVVNLILNLVFIPMLLSYGAAIATVIAETTIFIFQYVYLRKEFSLLKIVKIGIKYFVFGAIMFGVVFILARFVFEPSIINTIILVVVGVGIYGVLLVLSRDKFLKEGISLIKSKIKR